MIRQSFVEFICAFLMAVAMLFCAPAAMAQGQPPAQPALDSSYKLGSGDKVRVTVFGEDDLGGQFQIDGTGMVQLPLIGQVRAANLTAAQFADAVRDKLSDGYLKQPVVTVDVISYRPFYILGEVSKPGEYAYVNGMSVLNAVALAGGYTNRADASTVYIRHEGSTVEKGLPADETTKIDPGDIIRVRERFF